MVLLRSTYASQEDAKEAAARLIADRAAACVHLQPVWSTYCWDGKVEAEQEWLLEARTPESRRGACWDLLLDGHPYDNPLVEALPPSKVPGRYAAWAEEVTRPA